MRQSEETRCYSHPSQIVKLAGSIGAAEVPRAAASSLAWACAFFMALSIAANFSSSVMLSSSCRIADAFIGLSPYPLSFFVFFVDHVFISIVHSLLLCKSESAAAWAA